MIEAIGNTTQVQSATSRIAAREAVSTSSPAISGNQDFVISRIRVDNLMNVAILEYRSSKGEVIRQYPTESQIKAFRRAQEAEQAPALPQSDQISSEDAVAVQVPAASAPAPSSGGDVSVDTSSSSDGASTSVVV